MARKAYKHSAYWYAYHYGWTHSEAKTYTGKYLDMHTYRPRCSSQYSPWCSPRYSPRYSPQYSPWYSPRTAERLDEVCHGKEWFEWRDAQKRLDSKFNPLLLCACAMVDIGVAVRDAVSKFTDPTKRAALKRELMRDLRVLRRPFYYARETKRRRELAAERRRIVKRRTTAPMPTPEDVLSAWKTRKTSREAMIRLGGMLQDLSCYVDSCLRFDADGNVVGRNGGIREWLSEHLPELSPKYKTLMRYKAMAMRLRQATSTKDPTPTSALLAEPRHEVVLTILSDPEPVFSHVFSALEHLLSPETVLIDAPRVASAHPTGRSQRKRKRCLSG